MDKDFIEMKQVFNAVIEREAQNYRREFAKTLNVTIEEYETKAPDLFCILISDSNRHGVERTIARLFDGYSINEATGILKSVCSRLEGYSTIKIDDV